MELEQWAWGHRRQPTASEARLWAALRGGKLGRLIDSVDANADRRSVVMALWESVSDVEHAIEVLTSEAEGLDIPVIAAGGIFTGATSRVTTAPAPTARRSSSAMATPARHR